MTATEELRRMLDERGIEHDDEFVKSCMPYCDGYEGTYWGGYSFGYVESIRPKPNTIGSHPELTIHNCTPAQAIAATLGRERTCHWDYPQGINGWAGHFACSNCGHQFSGDGVGDWVWEYCPNCGAKVVDE